MRSHTPKLILLALLWITLLGCHDATSNIQNRHGEMCKSAGSTTRPATIEAIQAPIDLTPVNISNALLQKMLAGPQIILNSVDGKDGKLIAEIPDADAQIFSIYTGPRITITATVAKLNPGMMSGKFSAGTDPSAYLITKPTTVIPGHPTCHLIKLFYFSTGHSFFDYIKQGDVLYVVFTPDGSLVSVSPAKIFPSRE